MKRLRHPIRAIEEPFGKAGLIVAVLALVLALTGAAFAATGLNGKQKKEVEKIAKKFAGKPGAPGTNGTNGANGKDGVNGANGAPGSNGTSATTESFSGSKTVGSVTCTEGGVVVKSASGETAICNGKKGKDGETGFTATLPKGKTETGAWSITVGPGSLPIFSIPFAIPLAETLDATHVHYVGESGSGEECPGTAEEPEAEQGNLCVYQKFSGNFETTEELAKALIRPAATGVLTPTPGAGTTGALVLLTAEGGEQSADAYGTWAVTAP